MTNTNKEATACKVEAYITRIGSQNKAAATLKNVSAATLSQIKARNWDKIADEMWRSIEAQLNRASDGWQGVETRFSRTFTDLLTDAKYHSNVYGVVAEAGSGKTFTVREFAATHPNVYHIVCKEWWGLQSYLTEILRVMGASSRINNNNNSEMFTSIVSVLQKQDTPLLVFDEADKLRDKVMYSNISLYNELEGICGIVMCATNNLEKRIKNGVASHKIGYNEIYSRLGRRFVELPKNNDKDIAVICQSNGIEDQLAITQIANESEGDLRRVKRKIHALKLEQDGQSN